MRAKIAVLVVMLSTIAVLTNTFLHEPSNKPGFSPTEPRAAIVDHLSMTFPNGTFVKSAANILQEAGYRVDYYPGERVTVEFYRMLLSRGYRILVLRVHSSSYFSSVEVPLALFTSERFSDTKYRYELETQQLVGVAYSARPNERDGVYYGIRPSFVRQSMQGNFQDGIVIVMGCEGLDNSLMAKAFVARGAKAYIGWTGSVLSHHTDRATERLLQHLLIEGKTVGESAQETMREMGPDPTYGSVLRPFPSV